MTTTTTTTMTLESPTVLRLVSDEKRSVLETHLTYRDKKAEYELQKHKKAHWFAEKYGQEAYEDRLQELKQARDKCLLFEDAKGLWTYSGLSDTLVKGVGAVLTKSLVSYPGQQVIPWANKPFEPYPYQSKSLGLLLEARHAGVEICTGGGKSLIIANLCKSLALKTVVVAPSVSIARQLYKDFCHWFGPKYVGLYGDGRKDVKKLITVGIAASFTRVEPGSKDWEALSQSQVAIFDESHRTPAATLAKVCFGLLSSAPYRFFFSGTQVRNDGLGMLLDAITGPIVFRMTVKEGIDQGYLAKLDFTMVQVQSDSGFESRDAMAMIRQHHYLNPRISRIAAKLANQFVSHGKQVLIIIDELAQFPLLLPHLRHQVGLAHGGTASDELPDVYKKSDPEALVAEFNAGKLPILVGTSCISEGTDLKSNQATIYLRGGKSDIEVMQGAIGRSTRIHVPVGKTGCSIVDFEVVNQPMLQRHAKMRKKIYELVAPCKNWDLT